MPASRYRFVVPQVGKVFGIPSLIGRQRKNPIKQLPSDIIAGETLLEHKTRLLSKHTWPASNKILAPVRNFLIDW